MAAPEGFDRVIWRTNKTIEVLNERHRQERVKGFTVEKDSENFRELLVKNAAMALAALEAYDALRNADH